jgi:16S rRNA processing protein RimM
MQPDDRIQIGVVGKPHGVRGAFHLDGCVDAQALVPGFELMIDRAPYTVAARGGMDARPLVTLAGVSGRDAIAALRGLPVTARRGDLTPLAGDEWFADDLVGLVVSGRDGREVGTVERLVNLPSVDVLEVRGAAGELLMVPMVRDAIVSIEPEAAGVVVDDHFLDLG